MGTRFVHWRAGSRARLITQPTQAGFFAFGGSTILLLFPPKTVVFDADLVLNSQNSVETLVRMGSRIGTKA